MMKRIGEMTPWGRIVAIGYPGERYYWCIKAGTVSMMPACAIEVEPEQKEAA